MNAKIKRLWVIKALRSGKYRQAKEILRNRSGSMCCLGVLCEIQGADWRELDDNGQSLYTSTIPRQFNAGLRKEQRGKLANMNDGENGFKRHSFRKIADYIAKNL